MKVENYAYESLPVTEEQRDNIAATREAFKVLDSFLSELPNVNPRAMAIVKTNLEQASMWAVKSITHFGK